MLDENLPTFFIKPSSDNPASSTIFLRENGSELQPEYTLRKPEPHLPASKNCYAVGLYDSYNTEVLYAEVLVRPEWQQPTLSAAEIRAQNGVPPPPVPIVPTAFTIQLYNPDQQVVVKQIASTWNSSAYWEFEMPQNSFRLPSASSLDRSQSDPAVSDITPKIAFKWKRDGKLSKDISCFLAGKSTDGRKNKEPDITVAMFKGVNLTIYQPNMHRVDVEDVKGLEVVLLLGAAVIKDIFFNANREMFNISSPTIGSPPPNTRRKNSGPVIAGKPSSTTPVMSGAMMSTPLQRPNNVPASQIPPQQPPRQQQQSSRPPPADPRTQWEIDAETERLKKIVQEEERAREKADREEQKRIKKMLEQEEKDRKRRDAEVAKETERLRKQYGVTAVDPGPRVQFAPAMPVRPQALPQYQSAPHSRPVPVPRPLSTPTGPLPSVNHGSSSGWFGGSPPALRPQNNSPYLQAPGNSAASSSGFFGLGGRKMQKKRSVFF
ncbi:hypothetical protein ONS95_014907 [Cadophora gregata]|uniref:uncharacterized protein n=1 Tax=Cadophora gregata TaxID=51156 RepID=UPI0026DCC115|nr:uncharacterized protein ONS95_014907 [Cadophora gregata]KAK0113212.1 hypothetical protein ONS95_014907 [Cadophora gregata]KAK0125254.1 hypothetical protein ONS96_009109 [Cadophora gregata f. sp. sojae]